MALLKKVIITHTTSEAKHANTDAAFELQFVKGGTMPRDLHRPFEDQPHNEREKGRTDSYVFDVSNEGVDSNREIVMRMTTTEDGWLPRNMFVIGETSPGPDGRIERFVLGSHPEWPADGWFDRGSNSAGPDHYVITN